MIHAFFLFFKKQRGQCPTNHELPNTHRFKDSIGMAIISPGHEARPSHQACTHVAHHVPIQIGHHHHIKLLGLGHQLKSQTNKVAGESVRHSNI